jgi:hypothetical protein
MTELSPGAIPGFHDGFFDGVWISPSRTVHLFVRTEDNKPFEIVLGGVKALKLSNIREGNIILDVRLVDTDQLTASHMASVYEISDVDKDGQITRDLTSARRASLKMLELRSSYGVEGAVLCRGAELTKPMIIDPTLSDPVVKEPGGLK